MTEVKRGHMEKDLFPEGWMAMTYYRGAFDPGFRKMFYVLLPGNPYP